VLAARFKGEGTFELVPPTNADKMHIGALVGKPQLADGFKEAVFFFTDDTYAELAKALKMEQTAADPMLFASSLKRFSENMNDWIENQIKENPTVRNVPARILADLTDPSSKGFFLADFKGKDSGSLLFNISWNRDSLFLPEYANDEEVMLLHTNDSKTGYEWYAGFHLGHEYAQSQHPEHRSLLAHCTSEKIDLLVAKNNNISATVTMEYTVANPSRVIPFNLNGVMRVSSLEDGAGNKLSFIQEPRNLDSDPWLILSEPAKPGEKYKLKMVYVEDSTRDNKIVNQDTPGLFFVGSRSSWFPSFGATDDRTFFEINASSPSRYEFVASGTLISSKKEKDSLLTVWKTDLPLSVVGFNYGDFVKATQASQSLTVSAYSGKVVPKELQEIEHIKSAMELNGQNFEQETGILTSGFNTKNNVQNAAGLSIQAFSLYDFLFGPLPFKTVAVTEQPVRGFGQSWPNLIFLPYDVFLDTTTRNSLGLEDRGENREFYSLVHVHEMAHQWWGHLVGWKTYHDQWLSEGIADFASYLYLRQFEPKRVSSYWSVRRNYLLSNTPGGYRPTAVGSIWMNAQLRQWYTSKLIYYKGSYIMEMLRVMMYDPKSQNPDARFIAMMRDFSATFAGRNAATEDFKKVVEKHMAKPMDWFFDQWVYGTATPKYNFSYQLSDAGGGQTDLSMTITQSEVPESFRMDLPLYAVISGQPKYLGTVAVSGNKPIKTSTKLPLKPEAILLDPFNSILAEIQQ
jgi:hypothetical protein